MNTTVTADMPAWQVYPSAWKSARGIHTPHIGEISGVQYARLSKRGKREYDAKRDREWDASYKGSEAYAVAVIAAFEAGEFALDHPGLNPDALDVVRSHRLRQAKIAQRASEAAAIMARQVKDLAQLAVGTRVFSHVYREGTIVKLNRTTARVRFDYRGWETNLPPAMLELLPAEVK